MIPQNGKSVDPVNFWSQKAEERKAEEGQGKKTEERKAEEAKQGKKTDLKLSLWYDKELAEKTEKLLKVIVDGDGIGQNEKFEREFPDAPLSSSTPRKEDSR